MQPKSLEAQRQSENIRHLLWPTTDQSYRMPQTPETERASCSTTKINTIITNESNYVQSLPKCYCRYLFNEKTVHFDICSRVRLACKGLCGLPAWVISYMMITWWHVPATGKGVPVPYWLSPRSSVSSPRLLNLLRFTLCPTTECFPSILPWVPIQLFFVLGWPYKTCAHQQSWYRKPGVNWSLFYNALLSVSR